jgi:hypothetical protein
MVVSAGAPEKVEMEERCLPKQDENETDVAVDNKQSTTNEDASSPIAEPGKTSMTRGDQGEEESIPHVRPMRIGSADPPPRLSGSSSSSPFLGRGGVWFCEFCSKATVLPNPTKQWKCRQCHRTMYTLPRDECPLDAFCPCCCWDAILGRK